MTDFSGKGSRRRFADRILREMQTHVASGAAGGATSLLAQLSALIAATSFVGTDKVPTLNTSGQVRYATGTQIRTFTLGISGGNASIPEPLIMGGLIRSDTTNTDDLGTTGVRWKDGWFAGTVTAATGTFTNVGGTLTTVTQNSVTTMTGLTTIGTLVAGAVPASLVTAGTFGAGVYAIAAGSTTNALTVTTTGAVQLRLAYDGSNAATFAVNSFGQLTIASVPATAANELVSITGRLAVSSSASGGPHSILRTGGDAVLEVGYDATDFMRFSVTPAFNIATWRYGASGAPTDSFLNILMGLTLADSGGSTSNSNTTALNLPAGETGRSPIRFGPGVAPTSPVDGDEWNDGTTLRFREAGANQYASWTRQSALTGTLTDPTGGGVQDAESRAAIVQANDAIEAIRAALAATNITA